MCSSSKRRSRCVSAPIRVELHVQHSSSPGLAPAHLHAAATGQVLPWYAYTPPDAQHAHIHRATGIYFSIYAVGMVGTAYGIYSLAFVRLFERARSPVVDGNILLQSKPMKKDE